MPQATAFDTTRTLSTTSHGGSSVLRILPAAVVILAACGMLATAAFDRSADVTAAPRLIPAPSAAPAAVAAGDPSVPDASTVFNSREVEVEEPMPTF